MRYFQISPEVPGGLGDNTIFDRGGPRLKVTKLHYQFDGWMGDILCESHPVYIVTEAARLQLESLGCSGIEFWELEMTKSEQFDEVHPGVTLPVFRWLKVLGTPQIDDFGIDSKLNLVVSERVLLALIPLGLNHADIKEV